MSKELPSVVVIWKVTNFRIWASTLKDELYSPYFSLNGAKESLFHWYIKISREPEEENDKVFGIYLCRKAKAMADSSSWPTVTLSFCFRIYKMDDSIKLIKGEEDDDDDFTFEGEIGGGHNGFLNCEDQNLFSQDALIFAEDSISIFCELWNVDKTTSNSQSGISLKRLTSYIPVTEKCTFVWEIKNALDLNVINEKTFFMEDKKLSVILSYKTINDEKRIKVKISGSLKNTCSWVCCLTFPNNETFLFASVILDTIFLPWENVFKSCVTYADIFKNQRKYLTNESLVLNCNFSILRDDLEYTSCTNETVSDLLMLRKIKNEIEGKINVKTLLEDLTQLYHDKTLSDFTLDVQSKSFSVHSSLLIARSEVFSQMLQTNMKEKNERKLTIDDMDENAVSGMLEFIYTDNPGIMNVEQALKLYYAGDKYKIDGLVKKCFDFLVKNLTASNVSGVLELADRHSDEELKYFVIDYILQHEKEILLSKEFKTFSQKNSSLAAQTLLRVAELKYHTASEDAVKSSSIETDKEN